jgi:hypothetical protein
MRRTHIAVCLVIAASLSLTACATGTTVSRSDAAPPTPTLTPTPTTLVVAPGERPPAVFGGDCDEVASVDDLQEAVGVSFTLENAEGSTSVANLGGVTCTWRADDHSSLVVEVMPSSALEGAELTAEEQEFYFAEECDPWWVCGWQSDDGALWVAGIFQAVPGMSRESVDSWGPTIGARIESRFASAAEEPWTRDRTGWWDKLDCGALADALGAALGAAATGQELGYVDPPRPGTLLAARSAQETTCHITIANGTRPIELYSAAGTAWALPLAEEDRPIETGVDGITAYLDSGYSSVDSAGYSLTDGVNQLIAYVPTTAEWSADTIVRALAEGSAAGWD